MFVVLFSPELCIHLQFDILKVDLPPRLLHIALGHIVGRIPPVRMLREFRQFLPAVTCRKLILIIKDSFNHVNLQCAKAVDKWVLEVLKHPQYFKAKLVTVNIRGYAKSDSRGILA